MRRPLARKALWEVRRPSARGRNEKCVIGKEGLVGSGSASAIGQGEHNGKCVSHRRAGPSGRRDKKCIGHCQLGWTMHIIVGMRNVVDLSVPIIHILMELIFAKLSPFISPIMP